MEELDADKQALSFRGQTAQRDIVQVKSVLSLIWGSTTLSEQSFPPPPPPPPSEQLSTKDNYPTLTVTPNKYLDVWWGSCKRV